MRSMASEERHNTPPSATDQDTRGSILKPFFLYARTFSQKSPSSTDTAFAPPAPPAPVESAKEALEKELVWPPLCFVGWLRGRKGVGVSFSFAAPHLTHKYTPTRATQQQ